MIEYLCDFEKILNKVDEYLSIVNEFLLYRVDVCLCDNRLDIIIYKVVYVFNYYLLIELFSFDFDLNIREVLIDIVNDCLK